MRCSACGGNLDGVAFPAGVVRCPCGAATDVPPVRRAPRASDAGPYRGAAPAPSRREAGMLTCPFCGAPCADETRRCPHCDVDLATARCPSCYALGFTGARFCARCGTELRGEPIVDASDAPCPRCAARLRPSLDGLASECASCCGLFVDRAVLAGMIAEHEAHAPPLDDAPPSRASRSGVGALEAEVHYVKCPVCRETMNRANFGHRSGVIVDVCRLHGTWFDAGELTRVLEWVASGGARESRRFARDLPEAPESRRHDAPTYRSYTRPPSAPEAPSADTLLAALRALFRVE